METQKKLQWRQAPRIATLSQERWTGQAGEWNPGLNKSKKTKKAGRPAKRWEDDLTSSFTEATQSNDLKNDTTWLAAAKNADDWKKERKTIRKTHCHRLKFPCSKIQYTTSTATPRCDEDPELFVDFLRGMSGWTAYFLRMAYVMVYAVCSTSCAAHQDNWPADPLIA